MTILITNLTSNARRRISEVAKGQLEEGFPKYLAYRRRVCRKLGLSLAIPCMKGVRRFPEAFHIDKAKVSRSNDVELQQKPCVWQMHKGQAQRGVKI
jgi:hypothetical protein